MQASLERYLKSKVYRKSTIQNSPGRDGQETARAGQRKAIKRSRSLNKEEEEVLWGNGQLGGGTPRALLNTMWWLLTQRFGLRGRQKHNQMKVEDFTLQRDNDGNEFLTFAEVPTKTKQGGLSVKPD